MMEEVHQYFLTQLDVTEAATTTMLTRHLTSAVARFALIQSFLAFSTGSPSGVSCTAARCDSNERLQAS
jgi:hypothetical protein